MEILDSEGTGRYVHALSPERVKIEAQPLG